MDRVELGGGDPRFSPPAGRRRERIGDEVSLGVECRDSLVDRLQRLLAAAAAYRPCPHADLADGHPLTESDLLLGHEVLVEEAGEAAFAPLRDVLGPSVVHPLLFGSDDPSHRAEHFWNVGLHSRRDVVERAIFVGRFHIRLDSQTLGDPAVSRAEHAPDDARLEPVPLETIGEEQQGVLGEPTSFELTE